jgi:negative regulator of sigma E activity
MNESLSALLDGQCSDSELDQILAEMERNPALRQQFSRLCLAHESRMGTRVRAADPQFADRVLAALQEEPAVVVPMGDRVRRLPWRAATSLAAAAAVGAIAVLVVRPETAAIPLPEAAQTAGLSAAGAVPVAAEPVETQFAELESGSAQQLRNYLMAYSQSRASQGVGSTLNYARYAAYTDAAPATARKTELKKP